MKTIGILSKLGVLLVILLTIFVQTTHAIPVTPLGQRLILHTPQYRQRYHQQLLQQQRTSLQPTPPHRHHLHHRSVPNMGCEDIKSILESPHFQANASFSHLRQILDKYTENEHRETPEGLRTLWEKYTLDLFHPYREHLNSNFDEVPNTENNLYLRNLVGDLSVNRIKDELKKFYTTLVMMETRVKKIIEYQEEHKQVLIHKLTKEQYDNVTDFFTKVITNIHRDVEECRVAMRKFDMEEPTHSEEVAAFNGNKVDSWLIIQEYLRFAHFLTTAYDIMKGCAC